MEINRLRENKVEILLTREDMANLDITYEALDYVNPHTRRIINQLLETALAQTGFLPDGRRLLIQVFPWGDGGCQLYFTLLPHQEQQEAKACEPCIFAFDNSELLIAGCCRLYLQCSHRVLQSSLYLLNSKYYLVLYSLDSPQGVTEHLAAEYGQKAGEGCLPLSYLQEHGRTLISANALDTVCHCFGASPGKDKP